MSSKLIHQIAFILLVVGGINWGLVGLFNLNIVDMLLGSFPFVEMFVYVLVGISAVYLLVMHKSECMVCGDMSGKKKKK